MKKIFALTLFILFLFTAQTAFASWWNPFTWFQKSSIVQSITSVQSINSTSTKKSQSSDQSTQKNIPKKPTAKKNAVINAPIILRNEIPIQNNPVSTSTQNNTQTAIIPPTISPAPQQDSALKISQCQATRDAEYSKGVVGVNTMIDQAIEDVKSKGQTEIGNLVNESITGGPAYNPTQSTPQGYIAGQQGFQQSFQPAIDGVKAWESTQIEKLNELQITGYTQMKSISDSDYSKCISQ